MIMALTMKVPHPTTMWFPLKRTSLSSYSYPYQKPMKTSLINLKTNTNASFTVSAAAQGTNRKLPILLFDIMDTIVRDPFYHDVPAFFGMPMKELLECKHPTAWIEFEKGMIDEVELARKFFKDGRSFDLEGLKNCMKRGYSYIEGVEELLHALKQNCYEIHAFTNYPIWYNKVFIFILFIYLYISSEVVIFSLIKFFCRYKMIEDKLKISRYLSWTFCSCSSGKRKPDLNFYLEVLNLLKVNPANCIFIDDRLRNVEAAVEVGIIGLHFKNAHLLRQDLSSKGIDILEDKIQEQSS
ncbi:flavin mononucleotide hydrolase 1, chloroplatic isoform X1 [Quercus robur]|uniref:flavin mononucleotide hydrolase 1, chloroplatic isoform X1 n=2 Tax=Quercus robur TaxID=38942 RepID=UPI00216323A3|nr:flavin mononucleotide hydrolase 1, chloroplatic isoform X1 [Quercus robur]